MKKIEKYLEGIKVIKDFLILNGVPKNRDIRENVFIIFNNDMKPFLVVKSHEENRFYSEHFYVYEIKRASSFLPYKPICTGYFFLLHNKDSKQTTLKQIFVEPGYQSKGLGSELIELSKYISASKGQKIIKGIIVPIGNKKVCYLERFYSKFGTPEENARDKGEGMFCWRCDISVIRDYAKKFFHVREDFFRLIINVPMEYRQELKAQLNNRKVLDTSAEMVKQK